MNNEFERVVGTVSNLVVSDGEENFFRNADNGVTGIGVAAGLAASGLAGAAVGASVAAASTGDPVQFFSCSIDKQNFEGCFSKVSFKAGDELVIIAESRHDGLYQVLAAARPKDQTLWMLPHCSRGLKSHRRFCWSVFWYVSLFILIFLGGAFAILNEFQSGEAPPGSAAFLSTIVSVNAFAIGAYFAIRFYFNWRPIAQKAERIFATLGYPDPSCVDLPRNHKRYCKANDIPRPYLSDGPWIYRYFNAPEK